MARSTEEFETRKAAALAEAEELAKRGARWSSLRLLSFLGAVVFIVSGFGGSLLWAALGGVLAIAFAVLVVLHARDERKERAARARADIHHRHLARAAGALTELAPSGLAQAGHAYAGDIDLVGEGSLCQRMDVSHTVRGMATLSVWLGRAAEEDTIVARQEAVQELAGDLDLREDLEVAAALAQGEGRIDPAPFLEFTKRKPTVSKGLVALIHILPPLTLGLYFAAKAGLVSMYAFAIAGALQLVVVFGAGKGAIDAFQLIAARRGYLESLKEMLVRIEKMKPSSSLLGSLRERTFAGGQPPSEYMRSLDRWAGFAEFYTQFPLHFFVNLATCWDLHVLYRLERWNREVGQELEGAFDALGEVEALSSLATLLDVDESATIPDIGEDGPVFQAEELAHPLLGAQARVANSISLGESGSCVIITGSNMAGKSTMLRAVGLNIALALCGGPVLAKSLRLRRMRLRASMRVDDSLQQGASYFHAELAKLRGVVEESEAAPPIFFLLDELLRGTNARARHIGARAILAHLLDRGASGLTATHDIALSALEEERDHVINAHFTDVMEGDEMLFDYRLRDGVVKTSNALKLLEMAGIDVEVDNKL